MRLRVTGRTSVSTFKPLLSSGMISVVDGSLSMTSFPADVQEFAKMEVKDAVRMTKERSIVRRFIFRIV
jgi:hypothetical protein